MVVLARSGLGSRGADQVTSPCLGQPGEDGGSGGGGGGGGGAKDEMPRVVTLEGGREGTKIPNMLST